MTRKRAKGIKGITSIYRKTGPLDPLDDDHPTESQQNQALRQECQGDHIPDDDAPMDGEV